MGIRFGAGTLAGHGQSGAELPGQNCGRPGLDQPVREEGPERTSELAVPDADAGKDAAQVIEGPVDVDIQFQTSDRTRGRRRRGR
ncbi:hypothetical protein [Actinomadura sp.]|uniref:hypothetical protein n=1 Tax=Actinomadura sp. TaxID=1989 RepID=UPI0037CA734A